MQGIVYMPEFPNKNVQNIFRMEFQIHNDRNYFKFRYYIKQTT